MAQSLLSPAPRRLEVSRTRRVSIHSRPSNALGSPEEGDNNKTWASFLEVRRHGPLTMSAREQVRWTMGNP
ncbi:MAG TPA: hypothetical protein PKX17_07500, partial [Candidatus Methanomethylicus sp.]|nr:hypothetical protein [Candidatus Methanomethylicus sp.]